MNNDEVILTPGLILELERSLKRNGWKRNDVHTVCGGDILGRMRKHMLRPATPVVSLKDTLNRGPLFEPWKTITVGIHTPEELIKALLDEKYPVEEDAKKILLASTFASEQSQVNLAKLSHEDLGLTGDIAYSVLRRRVRHFGFELCTPEMVAELRLLNFDDQVPDPETFPVMEPVNGMVLEPYFNDFQAGDVTLDLNCIKVVESDLGNYTFGCVEYICVIP